MFHGPTRDIQVINRRRLLGFLSGAVAASEPNPRLAEVYNRMAEAEERHSCFWEAKLRAAKAPIPAYRPDWRTRVLVMLTKRFGPSFILSTLASQEAIDTHKYDRQDEARDGGLPGQEQSHARLLKAISGGSSVGMEGGSIAQLEGRHRAVGGNSLRAAVLGANDGLLSNFSLVMGVAGADLTGHTVLITGIAGMVAGACSMALGEWLSVQSARELYERQIEVERVEIEEVPDEEATELALIYEAKGLPADEAEALAKRLIANESRALDTLAREELGIDPDELGGSPWTAAGVSFFLFAVGAVIPVAPFFLLSGAAGAIVSGVVSAAGLFIIGAAITLMTGRGVLYSGVRQVLIGLAIGFLVRLTFAAVELAGNLIGQTMGLGFAQMMDPANGVTVPVVSQFYTVLATLIFLVLNGHLILIETLVDSFRTIPVGPATISQAGLWTLLSWGGWIFKGALIISLPALAALLLVNAAFGVMMRAAPQLNIFVIGFPISLMLGFVFMMLSLPLFVPQFSSLLDGAFEAVNAMVSE